MTTRQSTAAPDLAQKLGIQPDTTIALLSAPQPVLERLWPLPPGVRVSAASNGGAGLVLMFCASREDLAARFASGAALVERGGGLWLAWPNESTEITEEVVRTFAASQGWLDFRTLAIDAGWTALLFTRRQDYCGC